MNKKTSRPARNIFMADGQIRPGWRILLYIPVMLLSCVLFMLPLGKTILVKGPFGNVLLMAGIILGAWLCWRFIDRRDPESFGWNFRRGWATQAGLGILIGVSLTAAIFLIERLCGWLTVTGYAWTGRSLAQYAPLLVPALLSTALTAVMEETIFRGMLLPTLQEAWGAPAAIIVTSIAFGLLHLVNPTASTWARWIIPITLSLFGVVFALAYQVHRTLWLPVALHFAWNLFEYDVLALTGWRSYVLYTRLDGPAFWVGLPNSAFGPEVGLLGVLAMLAGIWFMLVLKHGRRDDGETAPERASKPL